MQSIYGFSQAEVRAFLELAEEGIGEVRFEVQRLRSNFRSDPAVVEWINACFARLMPQSDDRNRGAIAFHASEAAVAPSDEARSGEGSGEGLGEGFGEGLGEEYGVKCRGFLDRGAESSAVAEMIGAAIERHPGWRIAVLVRAKNHAREIAASLRARKISFRAVDIEPLQDRGMVRDIMMLTCALLHLGDRIAWLAVLRAPWAGLSLADLLLIGRARALVWDAMRDDALLLSLSADGRARCGRVRTILEAAFGVRNDSSLARWVERTWLGLSGPSC